jgi:hypothetical protein
MIKNSKTLSHHPAEKYEKPQKKSLKKQNLMVDNLVERCFFHFLSFVPVV